MCDRPEGQRRTVAFFTVLGHPATKGSTVSFVHTGGRVVTKADCARLAGWTQAVGWAARAARVPLAGRETAVEIYATFYFPRPKSQNNRQYPTVRPDLDKVARALLDALTRVAYEDDAQVVNLSIAKRYGEDARTEVGVFHILQEV